MAAYPWRCVRTERPNECGWTGDAQATRLGPPTRPEQRTWAEAPWCPRCGERAVPWVDGDRVFLVDGVDVPSGVQAHERPSVTVEVPRVELDAVLALTSANTKADYVAAVETLKAASRDVTPAPSVAAAAR
jgi:hypothetical protein